MLKKLFRRSIRTITIPEALWLEVVKRLAWFPFLPADDKAQLRELTGRFLATKAINGASSMTLTDEIRVSIAAQACLPILHLGIEYYKGWHEVIVYPSEFFVPTQEIDEAGVVHESLDLVAGEAWNTGPVLLSWNDSDIGMLNPSFNVVIHEFAHKIDLRNGLADGIPPLSTILHPQLGIALWKDILENSYTDFHTRVRVIEDSIPVTIDPHSEQADPYYESLPLDAYAAEDISEFFAVCSESFFMTPHQLQHNYPRMYWLLAQFYRQDPLARMLAA